MADKLYQGPFIAPAEGGVPHEEPDGVTRVDGYNGLRDTTADPPTQSGDWQTRDVPNEFNRSGSVRNVSNTRSRPG